MNLNEKFAPPIKMQLNCSSAGKKAVIVVISPVDSGGENETANERKKTFSSLTEWHMHLKRMGLSGHGQLTSVSEHKRTATGDMQQIKFNKTVVSAGCK